MAMTAAERKRKQRENSYGTATHTVTMSRMAKSSIKEMAEEYGCTVSELIDAVSSIKHIMWTLTDRYDEGCKIGEQWNGPNAYDPIFIALNWIYELNAEKNMKNKKKEESKSQPLLKTYKPTDL